MPAISLDQVLLHAESLTDSGRSQAAVSWLQQHRKRFAMDPRLNAMLGTLLGFQGDLSGAIICLDMARRGGLTSDLVIANLAVCLHRAGKSDQAEKLLRDALPNAVDPSRLFNDLMAVLRESGRVFDAAAVSLAFWRANPADPRRADRVSMEMQLAGDIEAAVAALREMLGHPAAALRAHATLVFQQLYSDKVTPAQLLQEHIRAAEALQHRVPPLPEPFTNDPSPERRLRIGYCSQDFRNRSAGHFIEGIVASHDPALFEVCCYHHTITEDALTARMRGSAALWRDISKLDDYAAARQIRADGVDIWIDLTGWTGMGRIGVCAAIAAPVQATYMGYACTTGLSSINARFVDALTDPPGIADACASERLLRLDPCFLGYTPPHHLPPVTPGPACTDPSRPITFGSFNTYQKLSDTCIDHWSAVLRELPDSRMLIKNTHLQHRQPREKLLAAFERRGVASSRLDLRGETPSVDAHLATYAQIDIALDSYPYQGTTTTIEALMMGVPVLSIAGHAHHARVGVSLLHAINAPHWSVTTVDAFVAQARDLASDRARLNDLRHTLRQRVLHSPLCDVKSVTRQLESHYRALWREWCAARG